MKVFGLAAIVLFFTGCAAWPPPSGSFSVRQYFDSREFITSQVEVTGEERMSGVKLYGFTDRHGDPEDNDAESTRFFSRYNVRRPVFGGVGPIAEYNDLSEADNGEIGAGLSAEKMVFDRVWLIGAVFGHAYGAGGDGKARLAWDASIYGPLIFRGFADGILDDDGHAKLVTEPELAVRLCGTPFSLLVEARYNDFDGGDERFGVAGGLEMMFDG